MNSTEANQTSTPIVGEVNLPADVYASGDATIARITASETQELSRRKFDDKRKRILDYFTHVQRNSLIESSLSVPLKIALID
jgi:hypothetical protein